MNHLLAGMLVRLIHEPDGTFAISCPSCSHLTTITDAMRTPETFTQAVAWIDCPCQHGASRPAIGNIPVKDCPCVARYQLAPTGTHGMYALAVVDHSHMRATLMARATLAEMPVVALPTDRLTTPSPRMTGRRAKAHD